MKLISSMATRLLLSELTTVYARESGQQVEVESVGGVDAAKRVRAGEALDGVVLASDVIDALIAEGKALAGSRVDLVRSDVAIAVAAGAPHPDVGSEQALKAAVLAAKSISYSTGPSGTALIKLFQRWGIHAEIESRLVQASPGIPVGSLVANGQAELGFQQLSELIHVKGIDLIGPMPAGTEIVTIFSGAVCTASQQPEAVRQALGFMASPATADAKQRQGMAAP
jgi:molybdate transport system substrate-binding protein